MQNEVRKKENERGAKQKREKNTLQQAGKQQLLLKSSLERFPIVSLESWWTDTIKMTEVISKYVHQNKPISLEDQPDKHNSNPAVCRLNARCRQINPWPLQRHMWCWRHPANKWDSGCQRTHNVYQIKSIIPCSVTMIIIMTSRLRLFADVHHPTKLNQLYIRHVTWQKNKQKFKYQMDKR